MPAAPRFFAELAGTGLRKVVSIKQADNKKYLPIGSFLNVRHEVMIAAVASRVGCCDGSSCSECWLQRPEVPVA